MYIEKDWNPVKPGSRMHKLNSDASFGRKSDPDLTHAILHYDHITPQAQKSESLSLPNQPLPASERAELNAGYSIFFSI